jgi:hypothetical protein
MALLTNRFNAQSYSQAIFAGGAVSWAVNRPRLLQNIYATKAGIDPKSGIPNGYNTGYMLLPLKDGGMSSFNPQSLVLSTASAVAKKGRAAQASATLTLVSTNAQADRIIPAVASDTLTLVSTNASISAGVAAVASATLTITGNASIGGIIPVTASSSCSITPSVAMSALAFMIAEAGGPTELSPEGLAAAVWNEALADYTTSGSAGNLVKKIKNNADLIPATL